MDEQSFQINEV